MEDLKGQNYDNGANMKYYNSNRAFYVPIK